MFGDIVLLAVMWAIGLGVYSIGVMQIVLIFTCAIPITRQLDTQNYWIDTDGMYRKFAITIVVWAIIAAAVVSAVIVFGNVWAKYGFAIGCGIGFFVSLKQWGRTPDNVANYFRTYYKHFPPKYFDDANLQYSGDRNG